MNRSAWLFLLTVISLPVQAQLFGENVTRTGPVGDDLYVAGGTIALDVEAAGDVVAAGRHVEIGRAIKGDVMAAGGSVDIQGSVLDDVRAAGGDVTVRAGIRGDLLSAGGNVLLAPGTSVGGRAWLAGGKVEMAGKVARELRIAANEARISGEVQGDVRIVAERLIIGPGAVIHGNLKYRSRQQATIDPGARISGTVTRLPPRAHREPWIGRTGAAVLFFASFALTAIVIYLLFPAFFARTGRMILARPWSSLALGLAVLVTAPVIMIILWATLLGMPLGFLLLAIYLIALPIGMLVAVYFLAEVEFILVPKASERRGSRLIAIVVACLILALIGIIPVLGALAWFVLWLLGLGALSLNSFGEAQAGR